MGALGAGAIGAGASLFTGMQGQKAASQGSQQMAMAQMMAALIQQQMFQQVQGNLAPYREFGTNALTTLAPMIGTAPGTNPLTATLTSRFNPTMEQLAATPGYQFTLDQGLKATQNAAAARGLGSSGNALRGAADYATGLASTTYQQQFQNYWDQNKNIFNMLTGAGNIGLNAAGMGAQSAGQFGNMIGNSLTGAGNALGAGTMYGTAAMNQGIMGGVGMSGLSNPYSPASTSMWGGLKNFFGFGSQPGGAVPAFSQPEMPTQWSL